MEIQKAFVTQDNKATLCCPKCSTTRIIDAEKYRDQKHTIKVRCQCSYSFTTLLDFRKHYRKEVDFDGKYIMLAPARGGGSLSVLNISRSGIGFSIAFAISGSSAFAEGQKAKIEFQLDDRNCTPINKVVIIRVVREGFIGCEFADQQELDKSLGFYLRP
jgi:hypothetical protein